MQALTEKEERAGGRLCRVNAFLGVGVCVCWVVVLRLCRVGPMAAVSRRAEGRVLDVPLSC